MMWVEYVKLAKKLIQETIVNFVNLNIMSGLHVPVSIFKRNIWSKYFLYFRKYHTYFVSACNCHEEGSKDLFCHQTSGNCECNPHVTGKTCAECSIGYATFPECDACADQYYNSKENEELTCTSNDNSIVI